MNPTSSTQSVAAPSHIEGVRSILMATLQQLTDRKAPMEVDRARAVAQVASVLVDTARVEVDYMRAAGKRSSNYLSSTQALPDLVDPHAPKKIATGTVERTAGRTVHAMGE